MIRNNGPKVILVFILLQTFILAGCGGGSGGSGSAAGDPTNPVVNKSPDVLIINKIDIQENTTTVLTVNATDPDGDNLTYSLDSAAADSIQLSIGTASGTIVFKNPPNFEIPLDADKDNIYETRINVNDGSKTISFDLKITIVNTGPNARANTAPTLISGRLFEIVENTTDIGSIVVSDKEEDTVSYSFAFSNSTTDDRFYMGITGTGKLVFKSAPNFEQPKDLGKDNDYLLNIKISDGELSTTFSVTITVTDTNDAPVIDSPTNISLMEKGEVFVQQVTAKDEDVNATLSFSISGGADSALFELSASGVLKFVTAPIFNDANHANNYIIAVDVNDGMVTYTETLRVYVLGIIAKIDTTFGNIDPTNSAQRLGFVSDFDTTKAGRREYANDVAILPDNKLIVVGEVGGEISYKKYDMAIWRYTEQGVLDTDLGTGFGAIDSNDSSKRLGYVTHNNAAGGDSVDVAYAVAITNDGKIVVVGKSKSLRGYFDSVVWRYTASGQLDTGDGNLDPGFGTIDPVNNGLRLGYVTHHANDADDRANGVVIASDNSVIVTGQSAGTRSSPDMILWKYTPLGELDKTFGAFADTINFKPIGYTRHNGAAGGNYTDFGNDVAITKTGNIIVVGGSSDRLRTRKLVIWSYTARGKLDTGFGNNNGYYLFRDLSSSVSTKEFGAAKAVRIAADNKIIVVCSQLRESIAVFRLTERGLLDTSFGQTGSKIGYNNIGLATGGASPGKATDVALLTDNRIIVAGTTEASWKTIVNGSSRGTGGYSSLWRFTKDGHFEGHNSHIMIDKYGEDMAGSVVVTKNNEIVTTGYNSVPNNKLKTFIKRFVNIN